MHKIFLRVSSCLCAVFQLHCIIPCSSKKISTIIRNQTFQKIRENERENENKVIEIKTTIVETDNKGVVENLVDNIEKKSTKPLLKKSKTIGIKSPVWA